MLKTASLRRDQIQIRDPFVVPVAEEKAYYLFGTTDKDCWAQDEGAEHGFDCYRSTDLENWTGPIPAFRPPAGFWGRYNYWAPEVHRFEGRWYMLGSFKADGVCRGTQILVADQITGPYRPHSEGAVTPRDWECLDGTLFVDEAGEPWMVFCHEWVQIQYGTINAVKLSRDLKRAVGEPITLFCARDAEWLVDRENAKHIVTDGPSFHRTSDGKLLMLWSSYLPSGYAIGVALSESGNLQGPWRHDLPPVFDRDGGHGMVFRTFDGRLMLTIHTPNNSPMERPIFVELRVDGEKLVRA